MARRWTTSTDRRAAAAQRGGPATPSLVGLAAVPLPTVVLDGSCAALAVNEEWAALTGFPGPFSSGRGWLEAVDPSDRDDLLRRLREATATPSAGRGDFRFVGRSGPRWGRWGWHPDDRGGLVLCVLDIDDDKSREAELFERATHDPLTGLVNRTQYFDLVERALRRAGRTDRRTAVVYIDLDGFKQVNDTLGHPAGDDVLRIVAARLASVTRPSDVAARLGGDEFAVLCEDLHADEEAEAVARRIREVIEQPVEVAGVRCTMSAATGIAVAESAPGPAESLVAAADAEMYCAKQRSAASASLRRLRAGVEAIPRPAPASPDAGGDGALHRLADRVVHHAHEVGEMLHAAATLASGPAAEPLRQAEAELDTLVRDVHDVLQAAAPPAGAAGMPPDAEAGR